MHDMVRYDAYRDSWSSIRCLLGTGEENKGLTSILDWRSQSGDAITIIHRYVFSLTSRERVNAVR